MGPRSFLLSAGQNAFFLLAGLALWLLSALPAAPQDGPRSFQIPAGCQGFLTVQSRACTVAHYWRCEADPEGTFWRVAIDEEGPFYLSHSDAEYRWLRNFELRAGAESVLLTPEADPASMTELLETGTDSMTFAMRRTEPGVDVVRNYSGFDSLTGESIEIDGEPLLITSFSYQYETDGGTREVSGNQFVSPGRRLFFGGIETTTLGSGESFESDSSPREFIEPGEPGYLSMTPIYDCGDTMSALPFPPEDAG